jgi:Sulfotransferase family
MVMLSLRPCGDSCVNRGAADAASLADGWRGWLLPAISAPASQADGLVSPLALHRWSSCYAVIAWGMNRLAGALFAGDETRLSPESLVVEAAKGARLDATPLADPRLMEALGALTSSLHKEASLSPFGRLAAGWDLKRMLSTLLILADAEREDLAIPTRPIASPIFITGLPRSGTTFLHGLLAEDPLNRAPRIWEAIYPRPEHRAAEFGAGRRKVQLQLKIFNRLSPGIRNLHPIEADAPEECIEITSQVFRSPRWNDVYRAPSYRAWLDASGFDEGYRFLARFLRHLQGPSQSPRRWILKSPEHVFSLDALTRVFPDARLLFVHRDPGHVLASAARLTELLRAPFTTAMDRLEIGHGVADYWQDGMRRMVEVADRASFPLRARPVHVRYRSLVSDPIGTIAQIYNAFGLEFSREAREAMSAKVAQAPNGGYGANRYLPQEFGIDPERERARASTYIERFGIAS